MEIKFLSAYFWVFGLRAVFLKISLGQWLATNLSQALFNMNVFKTNSDLDFKAN